MFELSDSAAYIIGAIEVCTLIAYKYLTARLIMKSYNENYYQNNLRYGSLVNYASFSKQVNYYKYSFLLLTFFVMFVVWGGVFPLLAFFLFSVSFLNSISI